MLPLRRVERRDSKSPASALGCVTKRWLLVLVVLGGVGLALTFEESWGTARDWYYVARGWWVPALQQVQQALTEPGELRALPPRSPRARPALVPVGGWLRIAHAGGTVRGLTYTNSEEALEASYARGARLFELDFHWTADRQLACIHDWEATPRKLFGRTGERRLTFGELERSAEARRLTVLNPARLAAWMRRRADAVIVVDAKEDPVRVLRDLRSLIPDAHKRLVPQVYRFVQFDSVAALGYSTLLLTLYYRPYTSSAVLRFVSARPVAGVVMPASRASTTLPDLLRAAGVATIVYGINDDALAQRLRRRGIAGIITDSLFSP